MATIIERVEEVLEPIIKADITPSTTIAFLHLDPLDLVKLICDLEEEFKIQIPDDTAEGFETIGNIVDFISSTEFSE